MDPRSKSWRSKTRLDGALVGTGLNDFIAQVIGDGNGGAPLTLGWQLVTLDLGTRTAGTHVPRPAASTTRRP